MAATSTAADAGLVSDAVTALNSSLGRKLSKPTLPTSAQAVVLNPDGTTTTQAIPTGGGVAPVQVAPGLIDISGTSVGSGTSGTTSTDSPDLLSQL